MNNLDEFIGNRWVLERVSAAIVSGRAGHVSFFYGPEGLGKTTAARLLAARLLEQPNGVPLMPGGPAMDHVQPIASHPDVLIVEPERDDRGRQSIGIAQARAVRTFLSTTPLLAEGKVVLIDGVEYFTPEGGNALLKTLEEPPVKTVLFLIAHDPSRVLPTIRSRAIPVRFSLVPDDELRASLRQRGVNETLIEHILPLADGKPARAIRLADDAAFRAAAMRRRDAMVNLMHAGTLERLRFVAHASKADAASMREFPLQWVAVLREHMAGHTWRMADASLAQRLFEADRLLRTTNANPELVLEAALAGQ